jgi:hypothetical protein
MSKIYEMIKIGEKSVFWTAFGSVSGYVKEKTEKHVILHNVTFGTSLQRQNAECFILLLPQVIGLECEYQA